MHQRCEAHQVVERLADGCRVEQQKPQLTDILQLRSLVAQQHGEMRASSLADRCLEHLAVQSNGQRRARGGQRGLIDSKLRKKRPGIVTEVAHDLRQIGQRADRQRTCSDLLFAGHEFPLPHRVLNHGNPRVNTKFLHHAK